MDLAIELDAGSPRGTAIHATWSDNPEGLREKAQKLRELAGGISFLPLAGRSAMDGSGPYPLPVRLAPNDLDQLMKSHAALSGDLSESLGVPRALVGLGPNSTTTRPDALRSWIATTCGGWTRTLQDETARVLERPVMLDTSPVLARLVPLNQRLAIAARLRDKGWSAADAERLAGV